MRILWLTALETSEPVGVPVDRLAMIEQKPMKDAQVVAVHLDTGKEIRVMESLAEIRRALDEDASA